MIRTVKNKDGRVIEWREKFVLFPVKLETELTGNLERYDRRKFIKTAYLQTVETRKTSLAHGQIFVDVYREIGSEWEPRNLRSCHDM